MRKIFAIIAMCLVLTILCGCSTEKDNPDKTTDDAAVKYSSEIILQIIGEKEEEQNLPEYTNGMEDFTAYLVAVPTSISEDASRRFGYYDKLFEYMNEHNDILPSEYTFGYSGGCVYLHRPGVSYTNITDPEDKPLLVAAYTEELDVYGTYSLAGVKTDRDGIVLEIRKDGETTIGDLTESEQTAMKNAKGVMILFVIENMKQGVNHNMITVVVKGN